VIRAAGAIGKPWLDLTGGKRSGLAAGLQDATSRQLPTASRSYMSVGSGRQRLQGRKPAATASSQVAKKTRLTGLARMPDGHVRRPKVLVEVIPAKRPGSPESTTEPSARVSR